MNALQFQGNEDCMKNVKIWAQNSLIIDKMTDEVQQQTFTQGNFY